MPPFQNDSSTTMRPSLSGLRPRRQSVPPVPGTSQVTPPPVRAAGKPAATVEAPTSGQIVKVYGNSITLLLACLFVFNHFGRPFEKILVGYRIPAVLFVTVIVAVILQGGLRGFTTRVGLPLLAFISWMFIITPLSSWRSGSVSYVIWYLPLNGSLFLILRMAAASYSSLKKLFYVTVAACVFLIIAGGNFNADRFNLKAGKFGNSDDVALLAGFAVPFALFTALQLPQFLLRILVAIPAVGWLLYCIGLTATRAAIVGLVCMMAVYLWRVNMVQKVAVLLMCLGGLVSMLIVLPSSVLSRFATIADSFDYESARVQSFDSEAMASLVDRRDLLMDGINMTLSHPIWGVGPGQYPQYRGTNYKYADGRPKRWVPSHNTYIQISSENGIPGLVLYLLFLAMIYVTIRRGYTLNKPNSHADWKLGYQMCLCLEASYIYFVVCALFMTCDEHPHQFLLAGLAVAVEQMSAAAMQRQTAPKQPKATAMRPFPQPRVAL